MTDQQFPVCTTLHRRDALGLCRRQSVRPARRPRCGRTCPGCPSCAAPAAQLSTLSRAARRLERPEPPPTLWLAVEGALDRRERPWWLSLRLFGGGALAGAAAVSLLALGLTSWRAHRSALASMGQVAPPAAVGGARGRRPAAGRGRGRAGPRRRRLREVDREAAGPARARRAALEPGRTDALCRAAGPAGRSHRPLARAGPAQPRRHAGQRPAVRRLPAEDRLSGRGRPPGRRRSTQDPAGR